MSAPVPTLRIDTSGTAFGTAPTYTDRTTYLMSGSQYPVEITRGRSDERSEVDPATCSFFLKNDTGFWSPGNAAAPAAWAVGAPVNVRLTHAATTYDRFTGFVDAIEPTWPGGVQSWSVVKVTATDVTARLGIAQPLASLLQYEMLADNPDYLYPLGEAAGSTSAADVSANGRAVATFRSSQGTGRAALGESTELMGPVSGVGFDSPGAGAAASTTNGLTVLALGSDARPPSSGPFTWEIWYQTSLLPAAVQQLWIAIGSSLTPADTRVQFYTDTAGLAFGVTSPTDYVAVSTNAVQSGKTIADGNWHQVVGVLASDDRTARIYFDGELVQSTTAGTTLDVSAVSTNDLGGRIAPDSGATSYGFQGSLAFCAQYPTELSAARILAHYEAGIGTGPSERSDQRYSRIAGYGGITTSGLPTGKATMGGQKASGRTAVECLAEVARTEGTVSYATGAGALTFQARDNRYQKAVGLSLTASDIEPNFLPRQDHQGQFNELTVTRPAGASQVVKDATRQTADGRRDGGSFEVAPSTDEDAWQNANWQVANHKAPLTRLPALEVNLLARSDAITTSCLQADISTVVQVTGLPGNAPAATETKFIEGWTETISVNNWRMSFFTSPVVLEDDVLVLDDATYGALDTYRLAF